MTKAAERKEKYQAEREASRAFVMRDRNACRLDTVKLAVAGGDSEKAGFWAMYLASDLMEKNPELRGK